MLFSFQLDDHERSVWITICFLLRKRIWYPVQFCNRREFWKSELIVHLCKMEEVKGRHLDCKFEESFCAMRKDLPGRRRPVHEDCCTHERRNFNWKTQMPFKDLLVLAQAIINSIQAYNPELNSQRRYLQVSMNFTSQTHNISFECSMTRFRN